VSSIPRLYLAIVFITFLATPANIRAEIESLDIESSRSSRLMPYQLDTAWIWGHESRVERRSVTVLRSMTAENDTAYLSYAYNPLPKLDQPPSINTVQFPPMGGQLYDEQPVPIELSDITNYFDHRHGYTCVVAAGRRNDSAFLITTNPYTQETRSCYLGMGEDKTGNGWWNGVSHIWLVADLDGYAMEEAYVSIRSGRDLNGNLLAAVDLNDMSVRWSIPIAVGIGKLIPVHARDSTTLICVTENTGQGARDSVFNDSYSYLLSVSLDGQIRWQKVVGAYPYGTVLADGPNDSTVFLIHEWPYGAPARTGDNRHNVRYLSIISQSGKAIASFRDSVELRSAWTMDSDGNGREEIYSLNSLGMVRRHDCDLEVLAASGPTTLKHRLCNLPGHGTTPPLLFMATQKYGTVALDYQFNWLAESPAMSRAIAYLVEPGSGVDPVFVRLGPGESVLALKLKGRDWLDILGIYYNDFREFILAVLFSMLAGLIVMQVYRRRDKRSLRLIAEQKAEIERSHTALQEAQEKIIAAEKYRQAKDIAGGFAHEIRNALFPAKSYLHRLKKKPDDRSSIESTERAINRAIDSTRIISTYAHLEDNQSRSDISVRKIIDQAIESMSDSLNELSIDVSIDDQTNNGATIRANPDQLSLVFNNLLRNAIDALTGVKDRRIIVTIREDDQGTEIRIDDTGPGIPEDVRANVFDAFFTTRPQQGTGLGLTIAQKVVEAHEGVISIDADSKQGAGIIVRLPRHAATR